MRGWVHGFRFYSFNFNIVTIAFLSIFYPRISSIILFFNNSLPDTTITTRHTIMFNKVIPIQGRSGIFWFTIIKRSICCMMFAKINLLMKISTSIQTLVNTPYKSPSFINILQNPSSVIPIARSIASSYRLDWIWWFILFVVCNKLMKNRIRAIP